jgi:hypothetical protein
LRGALSNAFGRKPEINFAVDGLRCTVQGPLSRVAFHPDAEHGI